MLAASKVNQTCIFFIFMSIYHILTSTIFAHFWSIIYLLNFQGDRELVEVLLGGSAGPIFVNEKGDSASFLAQKSGRKLVTLIILEANVLRKLHASTRTHSIKEGEWT